MTHEEIVEAWEDDKDGDYIQINDDGLVVHVHCGSCMERICGKNTEWDAAIKAIREWYSKNQYWPNIWQVNDHGNVELYDCDGNAMGGLV